MSILGLNFNYENDFVMVAGENDPPSEGLISWEHLLHAVLVLLVKIFYHIDATQMESLVIEVFLWLFDCPGILFDSKLGISVTTGMHCHSNLRIVGLLLNLFPKQMMVMDEINLWLQYLI